jgi:hypothetical protein
VPGCPLAALTASLDGVATVLPLANIVVMVFKFD